MERKDVKWEEIKEKERERKRTIYSRRPILSTKEKVREKDTRTRGTFCKIRKNHGRRS